MKISSNKASETNRSPQRNWSESNSKSRSERPEQTPVRGSESVALSSESQNENNTTTSQGVNNLIEGMSDWAAESAGAPSQESETSSLNLTDGELLGQGRNSDPQQVTQLQEMLNGRGQQLEVDGQFGPLTAEAVRSVQRELGVTVDGIVGLETMAALNGGAGGNTDSGSPIEEGTDTPDPAGLEDQELEPSPGGQGLEGLPPRPEDARGGQEFMNSIEHLRPGPERNQATLSDRLY